MRERTFAITRRSLVTLVAAAVFARPAAAAAAEVEETSDLNAVRTRLGIP
ncbi:hypothetical protein [Bradyrhizobium sp. AS23.2]|nr:hypothetical protein [Bradyrhizobium sp. AS23.2]